MNFLDNLKDQKTQLTGRLYRAKIYRDLSKEEPDPKPGLEKALAEYNVILQDTQTRGSDYKRAQQGRDAIMGLLKKDELDFTDEVREQARKLPKPEKISETKYRVLEETVNLETNMCTCRLQVGCKHICVAYGAEAGVSLKDRSMDQLRALLKLNNMSLTGRTKEDMVKQLEMAKNVGGAPPLCPKCRSYTDEQNGSFRCRKNREGRAKKCDFFATLPRTSLWGL